MLRESLLDKGEMSIPFYSHSFKYNETVPVFWYTSLVFGLCKILFPFAFYVLERHVGRLYPMYKCLKF